MYVHTEARDYQTQQLHSVEPYNVGAKNKT